MKRMIVAGVVVVLTISLFAVAQESAPTPKSQGGLFQKADADKDGKVTLAELQAVAPKMTEEKFKKLDKNADGALTKDEIPARTPADNMAMLKKADADKDGKVTLDELKKVAPKMDEARFGELDRNDDNVLTPADFPNAGQARPDRQEVMAKLKAADKDGNGDVTFEEAQAAMPKMDRAKFERLDRNHDGVINKADHEAKKAEKKTE